MLSEIFASITRTEDGEYYRTGSVVVFLDFIDNHHHRPGIF